MIKTGTRILILIVICLGFVASSRAQNPPICTFAQVAFNSVNNTFQYHCPNTNQWFVATVNGGGGSPISAGLQDPGSNGIVLRTGLDITTIASSNDIIALFGGTCSASTFLKGDGTCGSSSSQVYPSVGVAVSLGVNGPWSASLQVGTSPGNLVALDSNGRLPAVSAQNLTNFPVFNQNTTGNAATANNLAATPVLCNPGQAPVGILTNGNATGCQPVGGAAGATPNPLQASNLSNTTAPWQVAVDTSFSGGNPYVDVTAYGARAINPNTTPAATGLTATIASGSATANINTASTFRNGDGVAVYGAGATNNTTNPVAGPTVTPSVATTSTSTGFVVASPAGALTTCYKVAWRRIGGGVTAASPEVCTTTGNTLGSNPVTISTISQSNGTVTVVTASPHTMAAGAMVQLQGTSVPSRFDGWYTVVTVTDNTHFTFATAQDTRTSGAASGTGGTAIWFNCNHLALPTPPTGAYEAVIYAGASGVETRYGLSIPVITGNSADPTYNVWDDFGSNMMGSITLPAFIPTNPPVTATNDTLVTTIVSGAGTTTLTLATTAANSVAGSTIRFDNAPNIVAAFNAAKNVTGGMVHFPSTTIGGNLQYVTNSFLDLTSFNNTGVSQSGPINLGDTMHVGTGVQWHGDLAPSQLTCPSFAIQCNVDINTNSANPGIWTGAGNYSGVDVVVSGNAYIGMFIAGNNPIPTGTFTNMNFYGGGGSDFSGILFYAFTQFSAGGSAGLNFKNTLFSTGPIQSGNNGATATPLWISKNFGEISFDGLFVNRRGFFIDPNQAGQTIDINMKYERQGGITPLFTFTAGGGGFPGGWIHIQNTILDTEAQPLIANLKTGFGGKLLIEGTTIPGSSVPLMTGIPFFGTTVRGGTNLFVFGSGSSQNIAMDQESNILDGVYNATPGAQALMQYNELLAMGPGYALFTGTLQPAAPTCTVASAGPPFTLAGTYTFKYGVAYPPNNGVGPLSVASNSCVADGSTQQVTAHVPSAVAGATGYTWWRNGQMISCSSPTATTLDYLWTSSACGPSEAALQGGGPAGIAGTDVHAISLTATSSTVAALPAAAAGNIGQWRTVNDSTTVSAEGQTCTGGSSHTAAAFSDGTVWKCF